MSRLQHLRALILISGLLIVAAGCRSQQSQPALRGPHTGMAPALVVERFLNAANAVDLDTMSRLFGTRDGSILNRDPRPEVEARMYALSSILRHKNYKFEGEDIVPGRIGEAVKLIFRLELENREVSVPFVVVQTRKDGWMIEEIGIERVTAGK